MAAFISDSEHHDFGGFDEGGYGFAFFEAEFSGGIGSDNGGDDLAADGEADLGHEAFDFELDDAADELIASADGAHGLAAGRLGSFGFVEERVELRLGDAVMAAGGFDGAQFAAIDPLLDSGIRDAEAKRGFAGCEERCHSGDFIRYFGRIETN
jgi:hypothetical protein